MLSNHLILCHPILLLPLVFPSIKVFFNESALNIRGQSIAASDMSTSSEFSGLISLGGCPRDFQESSPAPQFEGISSLALSPLYGRTFAPIHDHWKNHSFLIIWIFVGKVIFLLFHMLSRFIRTFLPMSKHLLISWLQSPSAVILEFKKRKSVIVSTFPPSLCCEVMG